MPTIQQENGVKVVKGLPTRWGRRAYNELSAALHVMETAKHSLKKAMDKPGRVGPDHEEAQHGRATARYNNLAGLLDEVTSAPFPLDATDAHLCVLAERYAGDCANVPLAEFTTYAVNGPAPIPAQRERMAAICRIRGIQPPTCKDAAQAVARMLDPMWWRRNLRKTHGRTFEAAAIRLGFVSVRAGAYASDETVARRMSQNARNRAALESVEIKNEDGYKCTLADAASKTTSNKRIRRGELMLRMAGCEEVAIEHGHVGVFITLTAPSKYHAVIQKTGTINEKYNDTTPRQVQEYLQKTWARIRAAYGRYGIKPYGFRIAEPHHDGCVHWHALLFMRPIEVEWFCWLVESYALLEDGDEPGAQANRVKFEIIDSAKGSAAAYIAKYVSKNIDDDSEDAHDEVVGADGEVVKIAMPSDGPTKASQRVDAWAGVWSIRQFQPIGQPPVTVWRELRRVGEKAIDGAPQDVRAAWDACQRVQRTDKETGEVTVERPANFANYIRAQGGVGVGRDYRIAIAKEPARVEGRYGMYDGMAPVGIFARTAPDIVYASTRYTWTRTSARGGFDFPRSPVNNCTAGVEPEWFSSAGNPEPVAQFNDDEWYASEDFARYFIEPEHVAGIEAAARDWYEEERPIREAASAAHAAKIEAKRAAHAHGKGQKHAQKR